MSTQPYAQPQAYGAPPARLKFEPGNIPEIIALANIPGEPAPSKTGPPEVKFRLLDGRPWYVAMATADEIYRTRIAPRQQIEVTKTGRMKHEVRIVALQAHLGSPSGPGGAPTPPAPYSTYTSPQHTPAPASVAPEPWSPDDYAAHRDPRPDPQRIVPPATTSGRLLSAYMVAIDTLIESRAYAQRKGLAIEIHCEDVRCLAATIMIEQSKQAGAR